MHRRSLWVRLVVLAIAIGSAYADSFHSAAPDHGKEVPSTVLYFPIPLYGGVGTIHEQVTTASRRSQAFYDQGLTFLCAYDWIDAARSFSEALRHDSQNAMAYLGLSYAFSGLGSENKARTNLVKAAKQSFRLTLRERVRINLRRLQLEAVQAEAQRRNDSRYLNALTRALRQDPNNIVLILLRGNLAEGNASGRGQAGNPESIRYYRQVLALEPNNAVAHHFLIHAYEAVSDNEQAAREARDFVRLAPSLSHAHHMYGHELLRNGQLSQAIKEFETAQTLQIVFFGGDSRARMFNWQTRHNLNLLAAAYSLAGQPARAQTVYSQLANLPSFSAVDEYLRAQLSIFLLRQGRYLDAIRSANAIGSDSGSVSLFLHHAICGSGYANLGSWSQAQSEQLIASRAFRELSPDWQTFLRPWLEIVTAQFEIERGDLSTAANRLTNEVILSNRKSGTDAWVDTLFQLEFTRQIAQRGHLAEVEELAKKQIDLQSGHLAATAYK